MDRKDKPGKDRLLKHKLCHPYVANLMKDYRDHQMLLEKLHFSTFTMDS